MGLLPTVKYHAMKHYDQSVRIKIKSKTTLPVSCSAHKRRGAARFAAAWAAAPAGAVNE